MKEMEILAYYKIVFLAGSEGQQKNSLLKQAGTK
jgi:hypothetical protein